MRPRRRRRHRARLRVLALGWLALLVGLVGAVMLGPGSRSAGLALPSPVDTAVAELRAVLDGLPDQPIVIVGMDADLGTYAEIRLAVRAALDDLLQRGASLAFVSVTAEGRAIAAAEIERLRLAGTDA